MRRLRDERDPGYDHHRDMHPIRRLHARGSGFRNAYGIDLNPGPDNPFVRPGDFHELPEADGTVDLVYSNSLDHVYDFDRFFGDHARALKPGGYVLYELSQVIDDGGAFESVSW